jgi:putative epimerase/dehydratase
MVGSKVLVTGGLGNLGSYIARLLIYLGYKVTILTRKEKYKFDNLNYNIVECDITSSDELKSRISSDFDFCVHCASFNEFFLKDYPERALKINSLGTRNLLETLNIKRIKNFIYFSTFHVYGLSDGSIDEDTIASPKNDYASTHLFAEYYIKQFAYTHNLKYTILRLTNSYGAPTFKDTDKWYLVLNNLVKMAFEENKIVLKGNGGAKRDFIYMGDVANIVAKILEIDATNDTYNVSSGIVYDIMELAKIVKYLYSKRYNQNIQIQVSQNDMAEYHNLSVENTKLKKLVSVDINNVINTEIEKIFELLENG